MIEADVAAVVTRHHRESFGRGPNDVRATLLTDLVLVRSTGILTPTEERLATTERGRDIVRQARAELRQLTQGEEEGLVAIAVGCAVLRSHMSVLPEANEQIEVFVLEHDMERRLLRRDLDKLSGLAKPTKS